MKTTTNNALDATGTLKPWRIALGVVLGLLLAACAATPSAPPAANHAPAAEAAPIEPWDGDGMDIPLDGTSLAAFERSLARVQAYTSPDNYTTLVSAIEYLLVYELSAKRDRATLASHLNGLTGNQVIAKVTWGKPERNGNPAGQPPADAGSADI